MITLKPHQVDYTEKIIKHLDKHHFAFDISDTGSGKTYVMTYVATQLKLPVCIIAPKAVIPNWTKIMKENNVEILTDNSGKQCIYTYNVFSSSNGSALVDNLKDLISRKRTFIIIDESHNLKNKSARNKNLSDLFCYNTELYKNKKIHSKVCYLSATLYDNVENQLLFFSYIGIMNSNVKLGRYGFDDEVMKIKAINDFLVKEFNVAIAGNTTIELTDFIIKNYAFCSNYVKPKFKLYKGMFKMSPGELKQYQDNIKLFSNMVLELDDPNSKIDRVGIEHKFMESSEFIKNSILVRNTKRILHPSLVIRDDKNQIVRSNKVILFVNFITSIKYLLQELMEYNPLIIVGEVHQNNRTKFIEKFNEASDTHRLMICTIDLCGTGISLHDTDGRFPRYNFINPSYSLINIIQSMGRTIRDGTKSESTIFINYGLVEEITNEHNIKKSENAMTFKEFAANINKLITTGEYDKAAKDFFAQQTNYNYRPVKSSKLHDNNYFYITKKYHRNILSDTKSRFNILIEMNDLLIVNDAREQEKFFREFSYSSDMLWKKAILTNSAMKYMNENIAVKDMSHPEQKLINSLNNKGTVVSGIRRKTETSVVEDPEFTIDGCPIICDSFSEDILTIYEDCMNESTTYFANTAMKFNTDIENFVDYSKNNYLSFYIRELALNKIFDNKKKDSNIKIKSIEESCKIVKQTDNNNNVKRILT